MNARLISVRIFYFCHSPAYCVQLKDANASRRVSLESSRAEAEQVSLPTGVLLLLLGDGGLGQGSQGL